MRRGTNLYVFVIIVYLLTWVGAATGSLPEQTKLLASDGNDNDYFGRSVSMSGEYAIIGANGDDDNGINSGSAYMFKRDGESWSEQAKLVASDGDVNDWFGESVSISGDYAIVGAVGDDDNGSLSGSAYIFKRDGESWSEQAKLVASDGNTGDVFGGSVCISGDYAIVGAIGTPTVPFGGSLGSAYIFKRNGESWSEQTKLTASDGNDKDHFGRSVSISGEYAIVGDDGDDYGGGQLGSAYIYKRDGESWSEQAKLTASDGTASDNFGRSVSISGDYVIVGANYDDDNGEYSGSAYIFRRDGTIWSEQAKLLASDGTADNLFGDAVSISGDYAIIGGWRANSAAGSAYIFRRNGESWSEQTKLIASDGTYIFGFSVSIGGDYAIVGAIGDDDNGEDSGSVYVFGRCPVSDLDGDCFVDFKDFAVLAGEWLQGNEW